MPELEHTGCTLELPEPEQVGLGFAPAEPPEVEHTGLAPEYDPWCATRPPGLPLTPLGTALVTMPGLNGTPCCAAGLTGIGSSLKL